MRGGSSGGSVDSAAPSGSVDSGGSAPGWFGVDPGDASPGQWSLGSPSPPLVWSPSPALGGGDVLAAAGGLRRETGSGFVVGALNVQGRLSGSDAPLRAAQLVSASVAWVLDVLCLSETSVRLGCWSESALCREVGLLGWALVGLPVGFSARRPVARLGSWPSVSSLFGDHSGFFGRGRSTAGAFLPSALGLRFGGTLGRGHLWCCGWLFASFRRSLGWAV